MDISIDSLTDLVAIRLGEFPEWRGSELVNFSESTALREFILPLAAPLARKAVLDLPLCACNDLRDLSPTIVNATDWGDEHLFGCELPTDFLRLHSLWMPDWPCALNEEDCGDRLRRCLGRQAPDWLRRRTCRPMLRIVPKTESAPAQLWFGPTDARRPLQSAYIATPCLDSTTDTLRDIQPEALLPLADSLALQISAGKPS